MNQKLEELCKIYKTINKEQFYYDEHEELDYFNIEKDNYDINLKLIKVNNIDEIIYFIGQRNEKKENEIIFYTIIMESDNSLSNEFNVIKNEINNLNLENFIEKYFNNYNI